MTPPSVSTPSESGVTSSRTTSWTSPLNTPPWTAAPMATTSSGFTPLCGSFPKNLVTVSCTSGMRVEPPTSTTSLMSLGRFLASSSARFTGSIERSTSGRIICSSLLRVGELVLGLLGGVFQTLNHHLSLGHVQARVLLELGNEPIHQQVVDVVTAQVRVAVGGDHLDDVVAHLENRDVEGAAAEIVDGDDFVVLLVEAVREGRRGRLVDDALDVQARDLAGVLGGLALSVVEVRGHGDDNLNHLLTQVILRCLLQ